ncbi:helix-turn-helix domain-containing protein [Bacillus altitudinis]|uniref:helix-turn-helix domain-containing protein n=1 Tax=Bacillus altitudinis TaxID=293387 RepID=UPI0037EED2DD|nr:helix-turn-helix domain-containing protein [Bacillus altitudinis]
MIYLFGKRITTLRKKAGLTQEELAKKLNVTRSALSQYELGTREPNYDLLLKIADFFEVTVDYLIGRSDNPDYKIIDENKIESDPDLQIAFNAATDFSEEARKQTIDFINYIREKEKKSGRTFKKK